MGSPPPIPFDDLLIGIARQAVVEAGGKDTAIPSGPLHDAAEMARLIPTVMIFSSSSPPATCRRASEGAAAAASVPRVVERLLRRAAPRGARGRARAGRPAAPALHHQGGAARGPA